MSHQAFALTDDFAGMTGGSIAGPNGETIDLMELLDGSIDGPLGDTGPEGVAVVADDFIASVLAESIQFKAIPVPDGWTPAGEDLPVADELRKLNKGDLQAAADRAGIDGVNQDEQTKAQMLHALRPDDFPDPDAGTEPGPTDLQPDGTPEAADGETDDDQQGA